MFAAKDAKALDGVVPASINHISDILTERLTGREKEKIVPLFHCLKSHDVIDARIVIQLTRQPSSSTKRYLSRLVNLGTLIEEAARGR